MRRNRGRPDFLQDLRAVTTVFETKWSVRRHLPEVTCVANHLEPPCASCVDTVACYAILSHIKQAFCKQPHTSRFSNYVPR